MKNSNASVAIRCIYENLYLFQAAEVFSDYTNQENMIESIIHKQLSAIFYIYPLYLLTSCFFRLFEAPMQQNWYNSPNLQINRNRMPRLLRIKCIRLGKVMCFLKIPFYMQKLPKSDIFSISRHCADHIFTHFQVFRSDLDVFGFNPPPKKKKKKKKKTTTKTPAFL